MRPLRRRFASAAAWSGLPASRLWPAARALCRARPVSSWFSARRLGEGVLVVGGRPALGAVAAHRAGWDPRLLAETRQLRFGNAHWPGRAIAASTTGRA